MKLFKLTRRHKLITKFLLEFQQFHLSYIFVFLLQGLNDANIFDNLNILATSVDNESLRYIAAYESKDMPFYGVQFHPEKPPYEWNIRELNIPHSPNAIHVSSYFAEFFVNEGMPTKRYMTREISDS
jgi:Glutamine amidotransferase class-I